MRPGIRFRVNIAPTKKMLEGRARRVLTSPELELASRGAHEEIERIVRGKLSRTTTRDPASTKASVFNRAGQVGDNITSLVIRRGSSIVGGTGNTAYMDQHDPLMTADRRLTDDTIRLWRILEYGVDPFSGTLKARDPNRPMTFWWRRRGIWFVGKAKSWFRTRVSTGPYQGQPSMVGRKPFTEAIKHPGQLGRFYWLNSRLEAERAFRHHMLSALKRIF